MSEILECIPAYGCDYKSGKATKKAWDSGADFLIVSFGPNEGRYVNKNDVIAGDYFIQLRYNDRRGVLLVKV